MAHPNRKDPKMPCLSRRQILCLPATLWALSAQADLLPQPSAGRTTQMAQAGITPGTYLGQWTDGRDLRNTLRVISPDMITFQRQGYSTAPVPYHRIAQGRFQSGTGSSLTMISATRLRWTSASGTSVIYDLE